MNTDLVAGNVDDKVGPPFTIAKLMQITPITIWFMVLVTIVNRVYTLIYNCWAPHCMVYGRYTVTIVNGDYIGL